MLFSTVGNKKVWVHAVSFVRLPRLKSWAQQNNVRLHVRKSDWCKDQSVSIALLPGRQIIFKYSK